jgi:hypothetical protein
LFQRAKVATIAGEILSVLAKLATTVKLIELLNRLTCLYYLNHMSQDGLMRCLKQPHVQS